MKRVLACTVLFIAGMAAQPALADGDDHPEFFGAVKAFHDVLRDDWHAEAGTARNDSACRNSGAYVTLARGIAEQHGPDHARPGEWQSAGMALADASVALSAYCSSGAGANVEAGLTTLHNRFHDLIKLMRKPAAK